MTEAAKLNVIASGLRFPEAPIAFPDGTFQLRSVMTGQALGARSGHQIRGGTAFHLPREYKVEIVEIRNAGWVED